MLACNHQLLAVTFTVHQFSFPLANAAQPFVYVRLSFRKLGLKQIVRDPVQRLFFRKAVEPLGPLGPEHNSTLHVTHQYRRQLQYGCYRTKSFLAFTQRLLGLLTGAHVNAEFHNGAVAKTRASKHKPPARTVLAKVLFFVRANSTGHLKLFHLLVTGLHPLRWGQFLPR